MTPRSRRIYMTIRPNVNAIAKVKKTLATPKIAARTRARADTATVVWIALSGVRRLRDTRPSAPGRTPERPIAKRVLVPPLKPPRHTPTAELSSANRRSSQKPPQTFWARVATGHVDAAG